jgi:hypothetical protein
MAFGSVTLAMTGMSSAASFPFGTPGIGAALDLATMASSTVQTLRVTKAKHDD